jgi:ribonuclease BN (tRNA processing enzyme)
VTDVLLRKVLASVAAVFILMPVRSFAQKATPGESQKGVQILLLGTQGGPRLTKQRSEPANLLVVDGRSYLIDCGIGTMRRMLDAGVSSQTISSIFITHNHPDHALGLVDVLANDFINVDFAVPGAPPEFHIYGPPETPALVSAAYDYIKIPYGVFAAEPLGSSTLVNPFKAHVIDHDGVAYQDDKVRVTAAENSHYQLLRPEYRATMKSYSYRFDTTYGAIVFSGDTGPSAALEALAKGADVLISEVADVGDLGNTGRGPAAATENADIMAEHMVREHLSMKAAGELATKAQVKALILSHLVGGEDGARFVAGVSQYYSGPVFAGEDLARYCLVGDTMRGTGSGALRPCN